MTAEFVLFLVIGLGILLFEAHRQFNHPAYTKTADDEAAGNIKGDYIFSLAPSEIRSRSAFFSAELVYILVIVAVYLLLIFNDAVNNVLEYIINFRRNAAEPGGSLPSPSVGGADGATQVDPEAVKSAIDEAAAPFVVSMMMVTALRFPLVRRLEVLLRSSAQRIFGIPWIPHQLRQKIQDARIDLEEIGLDLGGRYLAQIERYRTQALANSASERRMDEFADDLSKLAAYQIWVNDLKIWPSQEFRSGFEFFRDLNGPLSDQINVLFKDCDLLAVPAGIDAASTANGNSGEEQRRIRQELWDMKAMQARDLVRNVAAMMSIYDQNSRWPEANQPGAASLRALLERVRAKDEAKVFQVNVAILLLMISAFVSFAAGYVHADRLESLARELGLFDRVGASDPQFNRFLTARNFMLSSFIIYGLSMWIALDVRRRMKRQGRWTNPFTRRGRIPPMGQFTLFFVMLAVSVYAVNLLYQLSVSLDWSFLGERNEDWHKNLNRQANLSLLFAIVGGVHGTSVALLMDLGEVRSDLRSFVTVTGGYVAVMLLLGFGLGQYYSSNSAEPIRDMREALYSIDLGLIALFTSVAITSFARSRTAENAQGAAVPEGGA